MGGVEELRLNNKREWANALRGNGAEAIHNALSAGLAEKIVYICGAHLPGGQNIKRRLVCKR